MTEAAAPRHRVRRRRWSASQIIPLIAIGLGVALLAVLGVNYARSAMEPKVRGAITDVQIRDIGHAQSITVHGTDGRDYQFDVADSVNMTPGHLREHMTFALPVTVYYRREGNRLVAIQVTD
jgi:hypothetical protein